MVNETPIPAGYKKTEVGIIPIDWEVKKLGEIANIATGNTPPTNNSSNYGTEYLFVGPVDLGKGKYILGTDKKLSKKGFDISRKFPKNSVLFTCIGSTIGKSGIASIELTSNQQINAIFPNSSFSSDFIFYCLGYLAPIIKSLASEQAVPLINKTDFEATQIPLPSLAEQQAIAAVLSDVDALITALDRLIEKKRNIKQGVMQQILTGQKRLPGFTGKWETKKLGDFIERIVGGGTPRREKNEFWDGNIYWATVKDLSQFNPNRTQETITDDGLKNSASNLIKKGILITSTRMALGKSVIFNVDVAINQDLKAIYPNKKLDTIYLYYWFERNSSIIEGIGNGSTVKGITISDLKNIPFFEIPLPEQEAIAQVLSGIDAEIEALEKKRDKYKAVKNGMMHELLTGKTRLI